MPSHYIHEQMLLICLYLRKLHILLQKDTDYVKFAHNNFIINNCSLKFMKCCLNIYDRSLSYLILVLTSKEVSICNYYIISVFDAT